MRPTVLLTGATGVVGSALHPLLAARYRVLSLVRPASRTPPPGAVFGDLTAPGLGLGQDERAALAECVDLVVHAAALTSYVRDPQTYGAVNADGTRQIALLAARARAPMIHISTAAGGARAPGTGAGHRMLRAYTASKLRSEEVARQVAGPVAVVRISGVLGDSRTGAIVRRQAVHRLVKSLLRGTTPVPDLPGDHWIDLVPSDLVAAYLAALACAALAAPAACGGLHWVTAGTAHLTLAAIEEACAPMAAAAPPLPGRAGGAGSAALGQILESVFLPPQAPALPSTVGALPGGPRPLSAAAARAALVANARCLSLELAMRRPKFQPRR